MESKISEITKVARIAVALLLEARGYSAQEATSATWGHFRRSGCQGFDKHTSRRIRETAEYLVNVIDLQRDEGRVSTTHYEGSAYFWAYKYRFWMRGDAHGNGYRGISIERARRLIHAEFLEQNLPVDGETPRHDQVVNDIFTRHSKTPHISCNY